MHIEDELIEWLNCSISDRSQDKNRNKNLILNRYGFGELPSPTGDELALKFGLRSRQRVQQIISSKFIDRIAVKNLPTALLIFNAIESHKFVSIADLKQQLLQERLISNKTNIIGLLNLAHDLECCQNYGVYNSDLDAVSRHDSGFDGPTYLIESETLVKLKSQRKQARTLPGQLGLAKFEYLRAELGKKVDSCHIIQLIRSTPSACIVGDTENEWYIFDDRDNTLINACEKIFKLTNQCDIQILSEVLENSLRRRTKKYNYPDNQLITKWIEQSKKFVLDGSAVSFLGEQSELTDIENSVVAYLKQHPNSDYPSIKSHLLNLNFSNPAIVKSTTTSPIVYVDKSKGKKAYAYKLVSALAQVTSGSNHCVNRYQDIKNKLKKLIDDGTDADVKTISRREQGILQDWLFSDESIGTCAICGGTFSTSALITAHKKKRALCTEAERVDPYIVFPLCIFGCDYLYENGVINIEHGLVQGGKLPKQSTVDKERAMALIGCKVPDKWLQGPSQYFLR